MSRNKEKKENPPVRLLGTMFLLVLGLVVVYATVALGIYSLVQRLVHLEDKSYTLLWPILILSVSAILGVVLAILIFRWYLGPLSRLMQATQAVAAGDYSVRVELRGARGEVASYVRSFNKMAEELTQYENTEIVSGKTTFSLDEQLRRCIRQQERGWLQKGLTVAGDLDPVDYYGNEELMEHIWSNLISNAIRFTPTGGEITVVLRKEKDEITVSVSDTGIGMDEETQRHIFDKFYRAEPYPDNRGNGLGLSIVRRAVELCGGQVTVFSKPDKGSTFTVTLTAEEA